MSYIKTHKTKNCTYYVPKYPEKYCGSIKKIICRSSWETHFCRWCDNNSNVIKWASEEPVIQYIDPFGKQRRYYPDFYIEVKNEDNIEKFLIEVKPNKETKPPRNSKKKTVQRLSEERKTYAINICKWKAAQKYCKIKGWNFKLLTEKQLFN